MLPVTPVTDYCSSTVLSRRPRAGLWCCRACLDVQSIISTPGASYRREVGEDSEEEEDEGEIFFRKHLGHPLVLLKKKQDRHFADRPLWDPLRTAYEEVTDGRENFILKSWRRDLNEPRQYALLRGMLDILTEIQLPDEPLREELTRAFSCSFQQADEIVRRLQRAVAALSPEELLPAYCSVDDPNLAFSYLSEQHLRRFVESCRTEDIFFDKTKLCDFFARCQQEDALTLELHQHCELRLL